MDFQAFFLDSAQTRPFVSRVWMFLTWEERDIFLLLLSPEQRENLSPEERDIDRVMRIVGSNLSAAKTLYGLVSQRSPEDRGILMARVRVSETFEKGKRIKIMERVLEHLWSKTLLEEDVKGNQFRELWEGSLYEEEGVQRSTFLPSIYPYLEEKDKVALMIAGGSSLPTSLRQAVEKENNSPPGMFRSGWDSFALSFLFFDTLQHSLSPKSKAVLCACVKAGRKLNPEEVVWIETM